MNLELSKGANVLGVLVTFFGAINAVTIPQVGCIASATLSCPQVQLISLLSPRWALGCIIAGAMVSALSKALFSASNKQ